MHLMEIMLIVKPKFVTKWKNEENNRSKNSNA